METNHYSRVLGRRLSARLLRASKKGLLVGALIACLLPQTLLAAITSDVTGGVLTVASDGADPIAVTCDTLQVKINGADPGSGAALCTTVIEMRITGGPGENTIDLNSVNTTDFTLLTTVTITGAGANDAITGSFLGDTINGSEGDDTMTGHRGADTVNGEAGNDTMIWNPGDGSDINNGGDDDDTTVVNGGGVSETFTITPSITGVRFDRVSPGPFSVEIISTTEQLHLNGNGGDDTITGTLGLRGVITMTLNGGDGNDNIRGGDGPDTLNGDGDNDTLTGFRGADIVNGGSGDDTMIWNNGDGSDINNGGDGDDTTVVNGGNVSETFTISGTQTGHVRFDRVSPGPFGIDIDPSTENLQLNGNGGDDVVTGTVELSGDITITVNGGDGNDSINGGDGPDTLNGDGDNDLLVGFRGADTSNGGSGDDIMVWNPGDGSDINNGGDGDDTTVVNGGNVSETFTISDTGSGVRFDRVSPGPFSVDIISTTENLLLNGNGGDDVVTGTVGLSGKITMTVNGGDGNDRITGGDGPDTLNGDGGNDSLTGFRAADTSNGGPGDDIMVWNPGDGSDVNNGGDDNDTTVVNGGNVSETFTISGTQSGHVRFDRVSPGPFGIDIDPSTENLQLNGNGGDDVVTGTTELTGDIAITVNGGDGNDLIRGGDGPDTLNGDGDNDSLTGFRGADIVNGGSGNDTMIWNNGDGSDINNGGDGDDTTVVNGGGLSETFTISGTEVGNVRFDRLTQVPFGIDIDPSTENLLLNGNDGDETVTGTVELSGKITMTVNGGNGNDSITGGDGPDTLNGDGDNDTLTGFRGGDTANGGSGNDTMVWNPGDGSDINNGGDGDDTTVVNGGNVSETFTISGTQSGHVRFDRVSPGPFGIDIDPSTENLELNGNGGDDVVTGTTELAGDIAITVNGGDGNDSIRGGDGPDTLNGDGDNDVLVGFRGSDTKKGGPGNDTLVWNNGDGSDLMDGGEGDDIVVVNGGPLSETFTITPLVSLVAAGVDAPLVGSVLFERLTQIPFALDIEAESVEVNGNEGDDTFEVTPLDNTDVHFDGGSSAPDDTLRVNAQGRTVHEIGNQINVLGKAPVTHEGVEIVEIIEQLLQLFQPLIRNAFNYPVR